VKTSEKDYVIVEVNSKPRLAQVTEAGSKELKGIILATEKYPEKPILFSGRDILANLGRSPKVGSVFGIKVEVLRQTIPDSRFGEIRIYKKMKDSELNALMASIKAFYKRIKAAGHHGLSTHLEIRNPHGKYLGYYKYDPKAQNDVLAVRLPRSYTQEEFEYIASHEYGHGIYHRMSNARTRSKWIKLYHSFVALSKIKKEELSGILTDLSEAGSLKEYSRQADSNANLVLKHCLKYVHAVHTLSKQHIETMLHVGEDISEYWPTSAIEVSNKTLVLTDYARKNVEELFAESYSHQFVGKKVPKPIDKLLTYTLAKLIRG
jgi:hypothetical protein